MAGLRVCTAWVQGARRRILRVLIDWVGILSIIGTGPTVRLYSSASSSEVFIRFTSRPFFFAYLSFTTSTGSCRSLWRTAV